MTANVEYRHEFDVGGGDAGTPTSPISDKTRTTHDDTRTNFIAGTRSPMPYRRQISAQFTSNAAAVCECVCVCVEASQAFVCKKSSVDSCTQRRTRKAICEMRKLKV